MPDGLAVTFKLGDARILRTREALQTTRQEMLKGMREGLMQWSADASRGSPVGVSGRLKGAYGERVQVASPVLLTGKLFNRAPYAAPVEFGARPHWPPFGPGSDLALWARRKLGDESLAFVVARSIARGTTRGTAIRGVHMVLDAFRRNEQFMRRRLRAAWKRAMGRL